MFSLRCYRTFSSLCLRDSWIFSLRLSGEKEKLKIISHFNHVIKAVVTVISIKVVVGTEEVDELT